MIFGIYTDIISYYLKIIVCAIEILHNIRNTFLEKSLN